MPLFRIVSGAISSELALPFLSSSGLNCTFNTQLFSILKLYSLCLQLCTGAGKPTAMINVDIFSCCVVRRPIKASLASHLADGKCSLYNFSAAIKH